MAGAPTPGMLRRLLDYDPATGVLRWKPRTPDLFEDAAHDAERKCEAWNARLAGKVAFTAVGHGYLKGSIFNRRYSAHRVCWAIHYGEWPKDQLDHINGDRRDNRIDNLRDVSNLENGHNQRRPSNNRSGVNGVLFDRGKWVARIKVAGRSRHLGRFQSIEEAAAARCEAERQHRFHPNHGAVR